MGRITKIKRLLIEEANKRLLGEQDPVGGDPNAGEIQKYLVDKGYLPRYRTENGVKKDNIDWDFGDISAKAFGDFIKDKLGVDVGIETLQDLQDYLDLLGFSTGDLGFGKEVYNATKWIIDFTEKGVTKLINDPKINSLVKSTANTFLKSLKGKNMKKIEDKDIDGDKSCDHWITYQPKIKNVELEDITHNTIGFKGLIGGKLNAKVCESLGLSNLFGWTIDKTINDYEISFEGKIKYYFEIKNGAFCLKIELTEMRANSEKRIFVGIFRDEIAENKYYVDVDNNSVYLDRDIKASFGNKGRTSTYIGWLPVKKEVSKKICGKGYCTSIDDIIKLIRGQENISNISNLMVDMCPPAPNYSSEDWQVAPDFSETIKHMMPKDLHNYLFKMSLDQQKEWRKTPKNLELLKKWISENPGTYQRIIDLYQNRHTKLV